MSNVSGTGKMCVFMLCCFIGLMYAPFSNASEEAVRDMDEVVLCIHGVQGTDSVYIGTEKGLYKAHAGLRNPEKISAPEGLKEIRDIAVAGEKLFAASSGGIYYGPPWERLLGTRDIAGLTVFRGQTPSDGLIAWSPEKVFYIRGHEFVPICPAGKGDIDDLVCGKGTIYLSRSGEIYRSSDTGTNWQKIFSLKGYERSESEDMDTEAGEYVPPGPLLMDASESGKITVVSPSGVFLIDDRSGRWEKINDTGIAGSSLRYAVSMDGELFTATDGTVFRYIGKERRWQDFFRKSLPGDITRIYAHKDSKYNVRLWIAAGRHIYIEQARDLGRDHTNELYDRGIYGDISILDVHRMAIEYAEVSPEKILRWRRLARWKAVMPRLSLGFSEADNDNVEIYKSASTSYVVTGPREIDRDWSIDLVWDLADLVWNESQTSIDVRSKLMVQLREDILEEVTRLYFERRRLIEEILSLENGAVSLSEGTLSRKISEKRLRLEELTAYIDALTGGEFSKNLRLTS